MTKNMKETKQRSHGLFYMENAGGYHAKPAPEKARPDAGDAHQPSCFALEEEKGEGWKGSGASEPPIKDKRPTL